MQGKNRTYAPDLTERLLLSHFRTYIKIKLIFTKVGYEKNFRNLVQKSCLYLCNIINITKKAAKLM